MYVRRRARLAEARLENASPEFKRLKRLLENKEAWQRDDEHYYMVYNNVRFGYSRTHQQ